MFIDKARKGIADFTARNPGLTYTIEVNGLPVSSEDSLGAFTTNATATISYVIQRMAQVGRFALDTAMMISPQGPTGRYKHAWFIIADGIETARDKIPSDARILTLINDEPYARKINVRGARLQGVPPGIVEKVRQLVLRNFGTFVTADVEFHTLRGGYVLKRNTKRHKAGEEMEYPTLVMVRKI
jgi:hypothetical protein